MPDTPPADPSEPDDPKPGAQDRRAGRLAAALRENLKRRKRQARGRADRTPESGTPDSGEDVD